MRGSKAREIRQFVREYAKSENDHRIVMVKKNPRKETPEAPNFPVRCLMDTSVTYLAKNVKRLMKHTPRPLRFLLLSQLDIDSVRH